MPAGPLVGREISGAAHSDIQWDDWFDRTAEITGVNTRSQAQGWLDQRENIHWANYVRTHDNLWDNFLIDQKYGKPAGWSMWDYGAKIASGTAGPGYGGYQSGANTGVRNPHVLHDPNEGPLPARHNMQWGDDIYDWAAFHAPRWNVGVRSLEDIWGSGDLGDADDDDGYDFGDDYDPDYGFADDTVFEYEDFADNVLADIGEWASDYNFENMIGLDNPDSYINLAMEGKFNEFIQDYKPDLDMSDIAGFENYATSDDLGEFQTESDVRNIASDLGFMRSGDVSAAITDATGDFQTEAEVKNIAKSLGYQTKRDVIDLAELTAQSQGYQTASEVKDIAGDMGFQSAADVSEALAESGFQSATDVETAIEDATSSYLSQTQIDRLVGDKGYQTAEQITATLDEQGFAKTDAVTAVKEKLAETDASVGTISNFIGDDLAGYEGGLSNLITNTKSDLINTFDTKISDEVGELQQSVSGDISRVEGKVDTTMRDVASDLGSLTGDMGSYIASGEEHQADILKIQRDMQDKALRIRSATSVGVGGAASFRGSRESLKSRGKARRGVKQFSRSAFGKSSLKI